MRLVGLIFYVAITLGCATLINNYKYGKPYSAMYKTVIKLENGRVQATAFYYKSSTTGHVYMITNHHVCKDFAGASNIVILSTDQNKDLCLLDTPKQSHYALQFGDKLELNQPIHTLGYPQGVLTYSTGKIYQYDCVDPKTNDTQTCRNPASLVSATTTLYSWGGASGSPVTDDNGNLVGVMHGRHDYTLGSVIPLMSVKEFVKGY